MPSTRPRVRPGSEIHEIMDINHILSDSLSDLWLAASTPSSTTTHPHRIKTEPKSPSTTPSPSLTTADSASVDFDTSSSPQYSRPHFKFIQCTPSAKVIQCRPIASADSDTSPSPQPSQSPASPLTFIQCSPSAQVKGKRTFTFWTEVRDDGSAPVTISHRNFGNHMVDAKGRVVKGIGCRVEKGWDAISVRGEKRNVKVKVEKGKGKGKKAWKSDSELLWLERMWKESVVE